MIIEHFWNIYFLINVKFHSKIKLYTNFRWVVLNLCAETRFMCAVKIFCKVTSSFYKLKKYCKMQHFMLISLPCNELHYYKFPLPSKFHFNILIFFIRTIRELYCKDYKTYYKLLIFPQLQIYNYLKTYHPLSKLLLEISFSSAINVQK